jgi:hypothetical protein
VADSLLADELDRLEISNNLPSCPDAVGSMARASADMEKVIRWKDVLFREGEDLGGLMSTDVDRKCWNGGNLILSNM